MSWTILPASAFKIMWPLSLSIFDGNKQARDKITESWTISDHSDPALRLNFDVLYIYGHIFEILRLLFSSGKSLYRSLL